MSNRRKSKAEKIVRRYGLDRCPKCRSWSLFRAEDGTVRCEKRHVVREGLKLGDQ